LHQYTLLPKIVHGACTGTYLFYFDHDQSECALKDGRECAQDSSVPYMCGQSVLHDVTVARRYKPSSHKSSRFYTYYIEL